ncbi:MAG: hypothetical protein E7501_02755 [Ruminococcus sp.]|nr:hypothetical protein [Ruminococcus sp.]
MGETKLCYGCMEPLNPAGHCLYCGYTEDTPSSPDYIKPGTMLHERYLIGVLLGYNGEGATYIAYDTVIGCKVLVREFMPRGLCARVKNAATISVQYNNLAPYKALMVEFTELNKALARQRTLSNINPVLDLLAENNTTYAVFEYIEGIKLIDYLKDNAGELTWNQVKELLPPLMTTLSLIHNAGVLHRGISPETIYVTEKGNLLISAFCISGVRTANTELKSELFQGYAAPEQYSTAASNRHGTWTDVYGISAVLYRILTGCMPTSADSRLDNDNLCAPHELNPAIPEQVSRAIMGGLMLSAQDRIATVTELVTKLFETKSQTSRMQIPPPSSYQEDDTAFTKPMPAMHEPPAEVTASRKLKTEPFDAYADLDDGEEASLLDRIKIPVVIGVLMLAILAIVIVLMIQVFDREESNTITSMSNPSAVEDVVPVTSQDPTDESENYDSEMFNLVGYNFQVKKSEYSAWFNLIGEEVYNDEYAAGIICEQDILPGEPFNTGDDIHVKVSLGPAECVVPDYKDMLITSYVTELKKLGVVKIREAELETQYYASGYVCGLALTVNGTKQKDFKVGDTIDLREEYELTVYYAKEAETTTAVTTTVPPETTTTNTTTTVTTTVPPETEQTTAATEGGEPMEGDLPGIEHYD